MRFLLSIVILAFVATLHFAVPCWGKEPPKAGKTESKPLPTVDDVRAYFDRGIVKHNPPRAAQATIKSPSKTDAKPIKPNRLYISKDIVAKFGEPIKRQTTGTDREEWDFECSDGTCKVFFTPRGYNGGAAPAADRQRLEIQEIKVSSDHAVKKPPRTTN